MSRKLQQIMVILGALSVSSAGADGFSATVGVPVTPVFGVGAALNYTYEISPNWFVGGTLGASLVPTATAPFAVFTRLGTNYIFNLTDTTDLKADAYVGGGVNAFSRYENGRAKPPLSLVKLLKVLDKHPDLLSEVAEA